MWMSKSSNFEPYDYALFPLTLNSCLRNLVSLFHVIGQEREWRRSRGLPAGFESLNKCKPLVAVGPSMPLGDQLRMADYFRTGLMLLELGSCLLLY